MKGYSNGSVIFTSNSTLTFNLKNVSTFIQTDRSRYQPGNTVKVRVVSVQFDNRPYKGRVEISLQVGFCFLGQRTKLQELWEPDVPLSHTGSWWEHCRQAGVHSDSRDCVGGIQFIQNISSRTVGHHNISECRIEFFICVSIFERLVFVLLVDLTSCSLHHRAWLIRKDSLWNIMVTDPCI